ncbi:MAG: class I SAM-dependent methyltransferase [Solirubrobacterales bacterium]
MDERLLPERRFEAAADSFVRARPPYPPELIESVLDRSGAVPGTPVLDVAAGAGALTELLLAAGLAVTAVEPNAEMAERLRSRLSEVPVRVEKAEALGAAGGTAELITIANGLHWVEPAAAYAEFARVLAPGGHVAVIWQLPDLADDRQAHLWEQLRLIHGDSPPFRGPAPGEPAGWGAPLRTVDRWEIPNLHRIPRRLLGDYISSWSGIANLPAAERGDVVAEIASRWDGEEIALPFVITVELGRRD